MMTSSDPSAPEPTFGWTAEQREFVNRVSTDRGFRLTELHRHRGGRLQRVLLAGEAHVKPRAHARAGRELIGRFDTRFVEGAPRQTRLERCLMAAINFPRLFVRAATLGWLEGSTIHEANRLATGRTFGLEDIEPYPVSARIGIAWAALVSALLPASLFLMIVRAFAPTFWAGLDRIWVPFQLVMFVQLTSYLLVRRYRPSTLAALVCPLVGLNQARTQLMVSRLSQLLADESIDPSLVIVGRAHLTGMVDHLLADGWFEPAERQIAFAADRSSTST